jgi:hypothetical protein
MRGTSIMPTMETENQLTAWPIMNVIGIRGCQQDRGINERLHFELSVKDVAMPLFSYRINDSVDLFNSNRSAARSDDPHAIFLEHRRLFTDGTQDEIIAVAFDFQGISGQKVKFVPE